MSTLTDTLRDLYEAFNARDIDTVLAAMSSDVDWPNGMEGTRELGQDAVRAYWIRQWQLIDPSVEPVQIDEREDGSVAVEVRQVVRNLNGEVLNDRTVWHIYRFEDGLVTRMEIAEG